MAMRAPGGATTVVRQPSKHKLLQSLIRTTAAVGMALLAACKGDSPMQPVQDQSPYGALVRAAAVEDQDISEISDSALTIRWTQVDDGRGHPADYELRYALPPLAWDTAELGCQVEGDSIGAPASCVIEGLAPGTTYELMLKSYRQQGKKHVGIVFSSVMTVTTASTPDQAPAPPTAGALAVTDLAILQATDASFTVGWTQVDDGTGRPARYRVKYGSPVIGDWSSATRGCDVTGDAVGASASCTISGLEAGTTYEIQLMSYRLVEGTSTWEGAVYSNVAGGDTAPGDAAVPHDGTDPVGPEPQPAPSRPGIWISAAELALLPTSGSAWNSMLSRASSDCGSVDLADQEQSTNVCIMAKALVFARTGESRYRTDVVDAVRQIVSAPTYNGRALALGRELAAYVIAADLIDLPNYDPDLDGRFRTELRSLRTTYTSGAASDLIDCHERRPNNWGAHCGATRAAIAVYLGDEAEIARTAQVFKGYLGDRSSYAGFRYGTDLSWQCDPNRPVGINPAGCVRNGLSLDGVLPDDQRRGGSFTTSPPKENYVWEALQGLIAQAVILHRVGYDVWEWEDRALLRAARWLHDVVDYAAEGDDTWQPHILNRHYGTSFPAPVPSRPGKNVGFADWTHK